MTVLKKVFLLLLAVWIFTTANVYAQENINVIINNKPLVAADAPVIVEGRTLVPLRAIGEAMGCEVTWVAGTQTANLKNETTIVSMQINNSWISKKKRIGDGAVTNKQIDVPPMLINDRTYIPARAFAEALDAVVAWDGTSQTVIIVYDTDLKYSSDKITDIYAGTGGRSRHDGDELLHTSFVSPEGIDIADDATIYISDSGVLRKISGTKTETIEIQPSYITVNQLKCFKNDVYIVTNEFADSSGAKYYGMAKISDGGAQALFTADAVYSKITDFDIADNGKIYAVQHNTGVGAVYVGEIDINDGSFKTICETDGGVTCIAADNNGSLYVGNSVRGSIYKIDIATGECKLFAGVDDNVKFVDGPNPMFFEPRRLRYSDGYLYVLDYNILRRIKTDNDGIMVYSETVAGKITANTNPDTIDGKASETELAPSYLMDFVIKDNEILLTDPKKAVIRVIK